MYNPTKCQIPSGGIKSTRDPNTQCHLLQPPNAKLMFFYSVLTSKKNTIPTLEIITDHMFDTDEKIK